MTLEMEFQMTNQDKDKSGQQQRGGNQNQGGQQQQQDKDRKNQQGGGDNPGQMDPNRGGSSGKPDQNR